MPAALFMSFYVYYCFCSSIISTSFTLSLALPLLKQFSRLFRRKIQSFSDILKRALTSGKELEQGVFCPFLHSFSASLQPAFRKILRRKLVNISAHYCIHLLIHFAQFRKCLPCAMSHEKIPARILKLPIRTEIT